MEVYLCFFVGLFLSTAVPEIKAAEKPEEPYVGLNIGTDVSNLLSPPDLVAFLQLQKINHVRLYDADQAILRALARTHIRVIVGIPNNQLLAIGSSNATAAAWVGRNILAFYPETLISGVAVGDEVFTAIPSSGPLLVPAMELLHSALVAANLETQIKISTPHSASIILDPFPPSQAFFNQSLDFLPLVQFLARTGSPLMLNLYPYYVFMQNRGVVPLENALFKPITPAHEEVDPNTLLHYTNVLDAMIDAAYFSMKNLNVTNVTVLVTETGWPAKGDGREAQFATVNNADTYNSNLIKHVIDRSGTPLHPEITSSVYIYELFNEDLRSGPISEANWGLFYGNSTPVYLLHVSESGGFLANDTTNRTFCVAAEGMDSRTVQAALDWACGPGRANCSEIQPGEDCYSPNNVYNHASYAFDSYYQKEGKTGGSCDFKGVAMITTTDPSHGNCIFPGSKKVSNATKVATNVPDTNNAEGPNLRYNWRKEVFFYILMELREKKKGIHLLEYFVERCHQIGVPCEAWVKKGDPKVVILNEVKRVHPDFLVVGNRGLGPFQKVFVGTVSEFCVKHAGCPVITIKRKADDAPQDPVDD